MGGFSVRILLSVFLTRSIPVAYKINNSASLHPPQIVYKNNSIPRRISNTTETFGGNSLEQGHCDQPATEPRISYKLKEISSSANTENKILGYHNRHGGNDKVLASGEGTVSFQIYSEYFVNAGGINEKPSKSFGNIIINSISNSCCISVHEVTAETINPQPLFEKRIK